VPKLAEFLAYWLEEIVRPNLAPKTYEKYEAFTRLHIVPYLGGKRLDKLQVKDIRQWLNKLVGICLCCEQGKDVGRLESKRRCCAIGKCCHEVLSARSRKDARDTLRAALTCAVEDEIIGRNPVSPVKLSNRSEPRRRKRPAWTVDDAHWFLESTWRCGRRRVPSPLHGDLDGALPLRFRKEPVHAAGYLQPELQAHLIRDQPGTQRPGDLLLRPPRPPRPPAAARSTCRPGRAARCGFTWMPFTWPLLRSR
jgi:hypothetical protein